MCIRDRVLSEAAAVGGVATGVLAGAGKTIGAVGEAVAKNPFTQKATASTAKKIDEVGKYFDDLVDKRTLNAPSDDLSGFQKGIADAIVFTRYRGATPEQIADKRLLLDGQIKPDLDKVARVMDNIENTLDKTMKNLPDGGSLDKADALNKVLSYLRIADPADKAAALKSLPKGIRKDAESIRTQVDTLSQGVLDSKFLSDNNFMTKDGRLIKDVIQDGLGSYVRRRYKIFEDSKYIPDDKTLRVADGYFRKNKTLIGKELSALARADVDNAVSYTHLTLPTIYSV